MIFSRYLCATLRTPSSESRPNAMTSSSTPSPDFLQQRVPHYLLTWPHQRRMVLFAVIVALVFINLTRPYALPERMGTSDFMYLVWSTVLVSFGAIILTVSRIIMTFYVRRSGITNAEYGGWMVVELLVMSVIFAVCFYCIGAEEDFMHALLSSLWKNALFLISPYVICTFYYSLQDKKQKLASLESDLDRATMQKTVTRGLLTFLDERGELQLSSHDNLQSSRQFFFGGSNTVRGYRENYMGGDGGFLLSTELQRAISKDRKIQGFVFSDYAHTIGENVASANIEKALFSMGFGVKAELQRGVSANLTFGFPLFRNMRGMNETVSPCRVNLVVLGQI